MPILELDQKKLQRKSEQLKEQKIKQIKDDIKCCLMKYELPEEIENIIIDYSLDESKIETNYSLNRKVAKYAHEENLHQKELQRKSELLKEQKIKKIKDNLKLYFAKFELPNEIENIIISYSFDESKIETNESLRKKVREYCYAMKDYLINELDVSCVTSMNYLFKSEYYFNESLDKWDTSNVVDMSNMFCGCKTFNQSVNFNTSKVIDMSFMFHGCKTFNQPVNFDTRNVTNMSGMLSHCENFNQPVNFDTKNVTNMEGIFCYC